MEISIQPAFFGWAGPAYLAHFVILLMRTHVSPVVCNLKKQHAHVCTHIHKKTSLSLLAQNYVEIHLMHVTFTFTAPHGFNINKEKIDSKTYRNPRSKKKKKQKWCRRNPSNSKLMTQLKNSHLVDFSVIYNDTLTTSN